MEQQIQDKINTWLQGNYDETTKAAIRKLQADGNTAELSDSFYRSLEFGTGGLRGLMGPGSNRMNKYTVGMATQGLSNYLKISFPGQELSVAIAHDSRNNSEFFAKTAASVFSANGIKVYFFEALRPTPELSFAIRKYGCQSGIVVTASHNPKEYNGYKAYWNDGAQMVSPHDTNTIAEVEKITSVDEVKWAGDPSKIISIGDETDQAYLDYAAGLIVDREVIKRQHNLNIVYTPLHGTGITLVPKLLAKVGFTNVNPVAAQSVPDGNFSTLIYPNPEEAEALTLALKQAEETDADLVMATDPDADRVGIAAKDETGQFKLLNGNQTATLLFFYMLNAWKEAGKITGSEMIVKTIVTTDLLSKMAAAYGVEAFETLTGFKYIAAVIKEQEGKKQFIVGGEESYGYLVGDNVRDKDAVASCALISELAAYAKDNSLTLFDLLREVYQKFGFYLEGLISITKKGQSGAQEIQAIMAELRSNPPASIAGSPTVTLLDYKASISKNLLTGTETPIDMEKSNVLQFITADGTKVSARPSGTEPKIKFYFSVNAPLTNAADYNKTEQQLQAKIKTIITEMKLG